MTRMGKGAWHNAQSCNVPPWRLCPPTTAAIEVWHATTRLADGHEPPRFASSRQARQREREERAVVDKITAAPGFDLDQQAMNTSPMNSDSGQSVDVDTPEIFD